MKHLSTILTHDSLGNKHVIEPHELRVGRVVVLDIPQAEHSPLLDLTEHREEGRLHAVAVERVLAGLQDGDLL